MLVTDAKAKEMLCPQGEFKCSGSRCMAWRWADPLQRRFALCKDQDAQTEPERPATLEDDWEFCPAEGDVAGWVEPEERAMERRGGYCGLAGDPRGAQK